MSDSLLETFLRYGTNTQRLAFTPDPPTVSGVAVKVLYEWRETDTGDVYVYDTAWHLVSTSGSVSAITALTGDVTATGPGSVAATIANNAVTTAKIATTAVTLARLANAAANDKVLGSGNSGSGASYAEITLGSGLAMTGTTLSATGSGGTVTHTGTLTSGKTIIGNGTADIAVSSLTANLVASSSGTLAGAVAGANDKLLGSGNSGSGAAYAEITLGTGITMTGTTLSASGTGAPVGAQYVTLATDGTLTSERVLTAGKNISLTDAGAGSTVTMASSIPLTNDGNSSTALTIDWTSKPRDEHRFTLTGNVTLTLSNPVDGGAYVLLIYTGAGGFSVTWPGTVKWPASSAPTITATASRLDLVTLIYDSTATAYYGSFNQNYTP